MSKYAQGTRPVTIRTIASAYVENRPLSVITCYDAAFARLVEKSTVDMVLVGDSLGNVMLGHDDTIPVTMEDMIHHTSAVSRALKRPFLIADMPFLSYKISPMQALENAGRLLQEGGAQAVKLEGGKEVCAAVKSIVDAGIPVMGHLGLTPQSVHQMGGYRVQGRHDDEAKILIDNALALQDAGVFSLVLELVPAKLAAEVTEALNVPTIGIGAGPQCSGQVLVLQDMLGFDSSFSPKFLKRYADLDTTVTNALNAYHSDVLEGKFPTEEHSF